MDRPVPVRPRPLPARRSCARSPSPDRWAQARTIVALAIPIPLRDTRPAEANNAKEEEFGDERFAEVLTANRHKSAPEIVAAVNQALTEFAAGSPPADDITLIVARRV